MPITSFSFKSVITIVFLAVLGLSAAACSPAVGSPEWCAQMKEKPNGDWTVNEAGDFAKNCIL